MGIGKFRTSLIFIVLLLHFMSCGQESLVTCDESLPEDEQSANCVQKTPDERAVIFLNEENFDEAITVLETELDNDANAGVSPSYVRYVRLASAYAGKANCPFLVLLESLTSSSSGEIDCEIGVSFTELNILGEIEKISYLNRAIKKIAEIPEVIMNPANAEDQDFFVGSAKLQSSMYIPVHTTKCLKLFSFVYEAQEERKQFLNADRLADTACQPGQLADNLLQAALDLVSTLGCGESVSQEVCDAQQEQIREQAQEISRRSTIGDSENEISNLVVSLCEEENPGAECPSLDL